MATEGAHAKTMRAGGLVTGATAIAITDLFLSATAALLIVLALARPDSPVPVPIQADLVAFCPEENSRQASMLLVAAQSSIAAKSEGLVLAGPKTQLSKPEELVIVFQELGLAADYFFNIALVGAVDRPVTIDCIRFLNRSIVDAHNQSLTDQSVDQPFKAVLAAKVTGHKILEGL